MARRLEVCVIYGLLNDFRQPETASLKPILHNHFTFLTVAVHLVA